MDQTQAAPEAHITYYGGKWVAFAPILLAIVGLIYIAVKQADVPEYWVVFLLPMIVCLFLAKDKTAYCEAIIEGATNKVGGILIMAVLLAGICGQLIETSGLVDTLAHYLIELNFLGNKFVAASFLLTCLIAFSTGTSVGTIFVVGPILYPIGYLVGATPALMIGAIVSGAAFGDNVSPVSDTLIAASSSQKVDLGGVFRSRLKYVLPAAALTLILYLALGSRGEAADLSARPECRGPAYGPAVPAGARGGGGLLPAPAPPAGGAELWHRHRRTPGTGHRHHHLQRHHFRPGTPERRRPHHGGHRGRGPHHPAGYAAVRPDPPAGKGRLH